MTFNMHDLVICIKAVFILSIVWLCDNLMIQLASVHFFSENLRNFFIETKEAINWTVSILVLIATIIKIRKDTKK